MTWQFRTWPLLVEMTLILQLHFREIQDTLSRIFKTVWHSANETIRIFPPRAVYRVKAADVTGLHCMVAQFFYFFSHFLSLTLTQSWNNALLGTHVAQCGLELNENPIKYSRLRCFQFFRYLELKHFREKTEQIRQKRSFLQEKKSSSESAAGFCIHIL